jgi:hypothetical protein
MKMTRRDAGWVIARVGAMAASQEFFSDWLRAAESKNNGSHAHGGSAAPPEPDRWSSYRPKFFPAEDFRALDAFTAILIPTDETPGAREAHVAHFIDFVLDAAAEHAPEMQTQWRSAMDWLRAQKFAQLPPDRQLALVEKMAEPERDRSKKHDGLPVYRLMKDMTLRAFYTSRAGLVDVLEYKGNAYLTEFPACTHPEHKKV